MTRTDENWGFLVASVIKSECPKCDRKYNRFGKCTRSAVRLGINWPHLPMGRKHGR